MANAPLTLASPSTNHGSDETRGGGQEELLQSNLPQQPVNEQESPRELSTMSCLGEQQQETNAQSNLEQQASKNRVWKRTQTIALDLDSLESSPPTGVFGALRFSIFGSGSTNTLQSQKNQQVTRLTADDTQSDSDEKNANGVKKMDSKSLTTTEIDDFITHEEDKKRSAQNNRLERLAQSTHFNLLMTSVIIANAVYIGVETDRNIDQKSSPFWLWCDVVFAALFSIELAVRLLGLRLQFFHDGWNLFDMALVPIAIIDVIVNGLVVAGSGNDELGVFSAMRILRSLRLARILRLLRFFKELWLLVAGFINSLRTLAWAWFLIVVILYIFGILATRTLGQPFGCEIGKKEDCDPEMDEYFGTIPKSMFSFFQMITTEGWAYIARHSMKKVPSMWIVFILFMSLTTFAIMNVIVAVIVENTLAQAALQRNDLTKKLDRDREFALKKIYEVFRLSDTDGNGIVSREEFMASLKNPDVMRNLQSVEIDMRSAEGLFDILDYDDSGSLDVTEFMEGCMRARGGAKAKDVLAMQCDLWRTQEGVRHELQCLHDMMNERFARCAASFEPLRLHFEQDHAPSEAASAVPLPSARSVVSQEVAIEPAPHMCRFSQKGSKTKEKDLPGAAAAR